MSLLRTTLAEERHEPVPGGEPPPAQNPSGALRVYLSGPMKGYPDSNFPAFHDTAAKLRARGLDVVNPAEISIDRAACDDERSFYEACLRADLKAMMDCHAIALMRGWEQSNGANLELHVAHRVGLRVLFVENLLR